MFAYSPIMSRGMNGCVIHHLRKADPNTPVIYLTLINLNHYRVVTSIADKKNC
uniref:OTU domain-containing protein n=1 Tax=Amphimedon queenslandica TaxID=400682 RepID=A0A1X7TUM2_AMPQE